MTYDMGKKLDNVEQIRDILFGSQLKEFITRLETVEGTIKELKEKTDGCVKTLNSLGEETDRLIEDVKQGLSTRLAEEVEALHQEIKSISSKDTDEKTDIRQQIDRLSKRLSSNVADLDETLDKQINSLRTDLSSTYIKLQADFKELSDQHLEELKQSLSKLAGDKISREDMAGMIFELFLKVRGAELTSPWKDASDSHQSNLLLPEQSEGRS
jgi:ABC-type phosphate transport system auxiliary subunit